MCYLFCENCGIQKRWESNQYCDPKIEAIDCIQPLLWPWKCDTCEEAEFIATGQTISEFSYKRIDHHFFELPPPPKRIRYA
jgi:hypothetical protein